MNDELETNTISEVIEKLKWKLKELELDYDIVSALGMEVGSEAIDVLRKIANERGIAFDSEHFRVEQDGIESYQNGINYALRLLGADDD